MNRRELLSRTRSALDKVRGAGGSVVQNEEQEVNPPENMGFIELARPFNELYAHIKNDDHISSRRKYNVFIRAVPSRIHARILFPHHSDQYYNDIHTLWALDRNTFH